MRIILAALPLLLSLSSCSKSGAGTAGEGQSAPAAEKTDNHVPCALGGAAQFAPVCTRDQLHQGDKEIWVLHHPDGGFRRFQIIANGTRIATADGAFEVQAKRMGGDLEVRVGDDRYRFPAAPEARPPESTASASTF
ncbi:MAG: hypothetical protein ABIW31_04275 [Novosphingobium sp.]